MLLTLNGGRDEKTGKQIAPAGERFEGPLDYEKVWKAFRTYESWMCDLYVNILNVIHYMHDKYAYEKIQMALHDTEVERFLPAAWRDFRSSRIRFPPSNTRK